MELAAYRGASFNLADEDRPELVSGARVSPAFFPVLGARAILGRTFFPDEEELGRDRVAVLSEAFWRRRFDADPGVLHRTIRLDGQSVALRSEERRVGKECRL